MGTEITVTEFLARQVRILEDTLHTPPYQLDTHWNTDLPRWFVLPRNPHYWTSEELADLWAVTEPRVAKSFQELELRAEWDRMLSLRKDQIDRDVRYRHPSLKGKPSQLEATWEAKADNLAFEFGRMWMLSDIVGGLELAKQLPEKNLSDRSTYQEQLEQHERMDGSRLADVFASFRTGESSTVFLPGMQLAYLSDMVHIMVRIGQYEHLVPNTSRGHLHIYKLASVVSQYVRLYLRRTASLFSTADEAKAGGRLVYAWQGPTDSTFLCAEGIREGYKLSIPNRKIHFDESQLDEAMDRVMELLTQTNNPVLNDERITTEALNALLAKFHAFVRYEHHEGALLESVETLFSEQVDHEPDVTRERLVDFPALEAIVNEYVAEQDGSYLVGRHALWYIDKTSSPVLKTSRLGTAIKVAVAMCR